MMLSQYNPIHATSSEAFKAVMFQVEVFWFVTPFSVIIGYQRFRGPLHPEAGGSTDLCNGGIPPQHTAKRR
jgi:hypothetical protein